MEEEKKTTEETKSEEQEQDTKSEEQSEASDESSDFTKDSTVPSGKYNQQVRKLREAELRARELEAKIAELSSSKKEDIDEDQEDDSQESDDHEKLIDEKLKPVLETLKKREQYDRRVQREAFFEAHPEYQEDGKKFQGLLDELDNSLNPNSEDDYYTQLEKAHRIFSGGGFNDAVDSKMKEMAQGADSGGGTAKNVHAKEEFTAEEKRYQKEWNISDEGMRAYKKKLREGSIIV